MPINTLTLRRGINQTGLVDDVPAGSPGHLAWTNIDATLPVMFPAGDSAINLILKLLISTGTGDNHVGGPPVYDIYEPGIGLGIPIDQIDRASFTAIEDAPDYDGDAQLYFMMTEAEPAKDFIETELCKPFGLYLITGNDGRIKCKRSRHPKKFYIGNANRRLALKSPAGGSTQTALLDIGVYDAHELANHVTSKLNGLGETVFSCSYSTSLQTFEISASASFDIVASTDDGWVTLGWTGVHLNTNASTANEARGNFVAPDHLTKDDLWDIRVLDNLDERICSVTFQYNYDPDARVYRASRRYTDPRYSELDDTFDGAQDYWIRSRGLIASGSWVENYNDGGSCAYSQQAMASSSAVALNADTWAKLHALSLIDRYRQPPLKFRANLRWKWNHLEVGDVVKVSYDVPGVFADVERNKEVLDSNDNRLFEIVELHPNFDGSIEATFLGHRYVSY